MTKKSSTEKDDIHLSVAAGDHDRDTDRPRHHHSKKKKTTKHNHHHHHPHRHHRHHDNKKENKRHKEKKTHEDYGLDEEIGVVERVEAGFDTPIDDNLGIIETKDRKTEFHSHSETNYHPHHRGTNEHVLVEPDGEYYSDEEEEVEEIEEVEALPAVDTEESMVEVPLGGGRSPERKKSQEKDKKMVAVTTRKKKVANVARPESQTRTLTHREEEQFKSDFLTCFLATAFCSILGSAVVWYVNGHRANYPTKEARKGFLCAFVPTFIIGVIIVIVVVGSYNKATPTEPWPPDVQIVYHPPWGQGPEPDGFW